MEIPTDKYNKCNYIHIFIDSGSCTSTHYLAVDVDCMDNFYITHSAVK